MRKFDLVDEEAEDATVDVDHLTREGKDCVAYCKKQLLMRIQTLGMDKAQFERDWASETVNIDQKSIASTAALLDMLDMLCKKCVLWFSHDGELILCGCRYRAADHGGEHISNANQWQAAYKWFQFPGWYDEERKLLNQERLTFWDKLTTEGEFCVKCCQDHIISGGHMSQIEWDEVVGTDLEHTVETTLDLVCILCELGAK